MHAHMDNGKWNFFFKYSFWRFAPEKNQIRRQKIVFFYILENKSNIDVWYINLYIFKGTES